MLRDLVTHRDLLWLLTVREIRIRYARAALGAAWAVFIPLAMMSVFTVMNFGSLIGADSPYAGVPYPVFALCGLLPWWHFSTSLLQGTPSLVRAASLIKKSAFPRELIPLSPTLAALLDLAIGLVVLALMLAWYPVPVSHHLLVLPVVFALQLAFTIGVVLLLASLNLFYRDVNYLVQVGVMLAMFATSVLYPLHLADPRLATVLRLNPMSAYLDAYREALLLGRWPSPELIAIGALGALDSLLIGIVVFRRCEPRFAEEV